MRIGELAAAGGVSAGTVRFYEQAGLLAPPPRTPGGYRDYPPEAVARLRFVRRALAAGLRLAEIARVLEIRDGGEAPCAEVTALLEERLGEVRRRMAALAAAEAELVAVLDRAAEVEPSCCSPAAVCAILAEERVPLPQDAPMASTPPSLVRSRPWGRRI